MVSRKHLRTEPAHQRTQLCKQRNGISAPLVPPHPLWESNLWGGEKGWGLGSVTNGQWFNQLYLCNKASIKEMGILDHLTCLLRNLYAGQEATVRTGHGTTDRFQIGKGVRQGCILSLCLFNLYAEYIMWNARLDEAQTGIKIARRNINNLRYADDTTSMAEWRRTKEPLNESERGEWKGWIKAQHSEN